MAKRPNNPKNRQSGNQAAVWVKAEKLTPWAKNPRRNEGIPVNKVAESIKRFGWGSVILARLDGSVVAGHTRLKAHALLCQSEPSERTGWHPEALRAVEAGEVPVRYGDWSDEEGRKLALADNRLGELADWDEELLLEELGNLSGADAELIGWSPAEVDLLDAPPKGEQSGIPEPPANPVTKLGDVWTLGEHRLLCGDSVLTSSLESLKMSDVDVLVFDPPWDDLVAKSKPSLELGTVLAFTDGQRARDVIELFGLPAWIFGWDCVTSWYAPNRPLKRQKLCFWYGELGNFDFNGAHYGDAGEPRIVSNARGRYKFRPDPRGKHLSDLFQEPIARLHSAEGAHHHSKPVDWIRLLIGDCSSGGIVDLFAGSGSTLIAAEQLGRRSFLVELDPAYCDVIVERWENLTGGKATR